MGNDQILPAGGQAVIEGVLMMSPHHIAIAVRKPNQEITVKTEKVKSIKDKVRVLRLPVLRGVVNLIEMLVIGTKALNYSANIAVEEEEKEINWIYLVISIVMALFFGIFMFKFLPLLIAQIASSYISILKTNGIAFNLLDGVMKIFIFVAYIYVISFMTDIRRVFQYHGAEHMAVNCYEAGKKLIVKNVRKFSRFHPRCGTSFIVIVILLSIIIYTFIPKEYSFWLKLGLRLALLPLIAGVSYELLKFFAKHIDNWLVRILIKPGLWVQRLTTREPTDDQLEVSIISLNSALKGKPTTPRAIL